MIPVYKDYQGKSGIWGGPVEEPRHQISLVLPGEQDGFLVSRDAVSTEKADPILSEGALMAGAVEDPGRVFASVAGTNLLIYKVQPGDTLGKIAANFGLTTENVLALNPALKGKSLRVGQELSLLPASEAVYELNPEDNLALVAMKHGVTVEAIQSFNKKVALAGSTDGSTIVIPPAEAAETPQKQSPSLPSLKGYFVMPTTGFNWGKLHNHNAVDIANTCGTNVVAAQEGLVAAAEADGWNGGYGSFVEIEHPNGTRTKYAHLEKLTVSVGDYVEQRQKIGLMGTTGESTGCHLHFEVAGAKNPFVK